MSAPRRIVPDNSVMVPAFFPEKIQYRDGSFDLTKRALPLTEAILKHSVLAIAPEHLVYEFFKSAHRKMDEGVDKYEASAQIDRFRYYWAQGIRTESMIALADRAWTLSTEHEISPPDSWYLACAMRHDAELWISHRHQDGFAERAEKTYRRVYVLTEHRFESGRE